MRARFAFDFHHSDMRPEGVDEVRRAEEIRALQTGIDIVGQAITIGARRNIAQGQAAARHTLHTVLPLGEFDIALTLLPSICAAIFTALSRTLSDARIIAEPPIARLRLPKVPTPTGLRASIPMAHDDLVIIGADPIRDHLREGRLQTLPVR